MFINDNWKLYYVKDSCFKDAINVDGYDYFDDVNLPTLLELELYRHKILGHPYESTNIWDYQKYEDYHQIYVREFETDDKTLILKLHGVDTVGDVYLNGSFVGHIDNMFIPYIFYLRGLKKKNILTIHVKPALLEGAKFDNHKWWAFKYNYESLYLRKTASTFGWDILPRNILGGIYKGVELLKNLPIIEDVQIKAPKISKKSATLKFNIKSRTKVPLIYKISGFCGDSSFSSEGGAIQKIDIVNPKLWNIRGYGEPNLYKIKIDAYWNGELLDTKTIKYGIRKVELKRSSVVQDGGCFEFHINGQKVYLQGSNWVPIEAIKHIDDERMLKALDMIVDLNCNSLRIWGGGTYESDLFYEKCDELGIFIWQDFMMGCALYPQDEYFQNKLKEEATYIVKHLRNHPSICLWAGDNENDLAVQFWSKSGMKASENVLTRKVLPEVIKKEDGTRPYLPSSPYLDEYAENHVGEPLSEDHLWGPRDYFKGEFYGNASCYFTSETGYHGMNNLSSLNRFIKEPWPLFNKDGKPTKEYLCHATSVKDDYDSPYEYRIALMNSQVETLFINKIDNLEDFILASQISQAEAMKYFLERMKKDLNRNGGVIWWNIIDGWPQISDSVVDYYFSKKLAYYYIKRSQNNNLLMMNEDPDGLNMYCVSLDNEKHNLEYQIIDAYEDKVLYRGVVTTKPNSSFVAKKIKISDKTLLIIKYKDEKQHEYINHFHTKIKDIDLYKYIDAIKRYNLFYK